MTAAEYCCNNHWLCSNRYTNNLRAALNPTQNHRKALILVYMGNTWPELTLTTVHVNDVVRCCNDVTVYVMLAYIYCTGTVFMLIMHMNVCGKKFTDVISFFIENILLLLHHKMLQVYLFEEHPVSNITFLNEI